MARKLQVMVHPGRRLPKLQLHLFSTSTSLYLVMHINAVRLRPIGSPEKATLEIPACGIGSYPTYTRVCTLRSPICFMQFGSNNLSRREVSSHF